MTYPAITDTGYTGYARTYIKCPVCGKTCRRLTRHMHKLHLQEVRRY